MTQRAEAGAIADAYLTLDDTGRERFFRLLARDFWIDPASVREASDVAARRGHAARNAVRPSTTSATRSRRRRAACSACSPGSTAA